MNISENKFYGGKTSEQLHIERILSAASQSTEVKKPNFMKSLLGPSRTWKIFRKQQDAIEFSRARKNDLMCFVYEQNFGQRLFLVAHPKVFHAINCSRFFRDCSTYEVILEHVNCKLYLDLEFEYQFNIENIGDRMVKNLLTIMNQYLYETFDIACSMSDIMELDSSTDKKFSRHVIYQIPDSAFEDNYAVGSFVKKLCNDLKLACDVESLFYQNYSVSVENIKEFFVKDNKGKLKLFIDEGVYTKNRHFRMLGSTKLNKNAPLVISQSNQYVTKSDTTGLNMFLDSLITYFPVKVSRVLEWKGSPISQACRRQVQNFVRSTPLDSSQYPEIDEFVKKMIQPMGGIRKKSLFESRIVYEIYGYRYCANIGRHHKSNNIMIIVDLENLVFYQKCHDPDCSGFKSNEVPLPAEIQFVLEEDSLLVKCVEDSVSGGDMMETELDEILSSIMNDGGFDMSSSTEVSLARK